MTYYESAQNLVISYDRAIKEVLSHGADIQEFISDLGRHSTYNAQHVLNWLGY